MVVLSSCTKLSIHANRWVKVRSSARHIITMSSFMSLVATEPLIYRYELACCYCMQLEFQKAVDIFEKLVGAQNFQVCLVVCGVLHVVLWC
jgi:hypothetical protein